MWSSGPYLSGLWSVCGGCDGHRTWPALKTAKQTSEREQRLLGSQNLGWEEMRRAWLVQVVPPVKWGGLLKVLVNGRINLYLNRCRSACQQNGRSFTGGCGRSTAQRGVPAGTPVASGWMGDRAGAREEMPGVLPKH